jgi:NADPH:quinone reductase
MRALVNTADGSLGLELRDVAEPEPGPGDVVVEVRAFAVNRGELKLLAGRPDGWRPGQDVAGVVVSPAADGSGPAAGTRVVAWPEQAGWAQRVAVPADVAVPIADVVEFTSAATLPVAGVTALRTLRAGGELLGRRVLVTGAAGGVGRFAVELAARGGASVTAVTRDEHRAEGLAGLGDPGQIEIVHDIDDVQGAVDVVLESVGGRSLSRALDLIAAKGAIVVFGNSSGEPSEVDFRSTFGKGGARLEFFRVYESGNQPSFGEDLGRLAALVAADRLHPRVGLEISWNEARRALEALADRQVNGKAVLVVD